MGASRRTARTWEELGRTNPYWGVLSHDEFDGVGVGDDQLAAFWASGEAHIAAVLGRCRSTVRPGFEPATALDFGCGVGRLLVPLAGRCDTVYGIDMAAAMRDRARRHLAERGLANVELAASLDEVRRRAGTVDLVHSVLVLQHMRPADGLTALAHMVDVLAPGGCGVVQFFLGRRAPRWRRAIGTARERSRVVNVAVSLARGTPTTARFPFEVNPYSLKDVFATLGDGGISTVWCDNTFSADGVDTTLFFTRPTEHTCSHR